MKRLFLFTFFLTALTLSGYAQDICNDNIDNDGDTKVDCLDQDGGETCPADCKEIPGDGIDNDGDFFIDCYDKEIILTDACDGFFIGKDPCGVAPLNPKPFAMKLKFKSPPQTANHINRLLVGDVDDDGTPEIVTTYRNADDPTIGRLNFLQAPGTVGATVLNLDRSIDLLANGDRPTFEDIAMADINKDGCAEIFVLTATNDGGTYRIIAYNCNGTRIWTNPITFGFYPGNMGLADFNGDGDIELYCRTQIFNAHTGALLGSSNIDSDNTGIHKDVNKGWGMNSSGPIAVDVLGTRDLELVAGCRIYSVAINKVAQTATLNLVRQRPEYGTRTGRTTASGTSVADFNQDGTLDVMAVGSLGGYDLTTTIFFWDLKTDALKTYTDLSGTGSYLNGWKNGAGRINLADIDGDAQMNAVYVSGKYLYALKEVAGGTGLDTLWREPVTEETSGYTGCTMFDFNADAKSEIVYRDEDYIYIFTTLTDGTVIKSPPVRCASRTSNEYPIVADMDGDGSTEICVACAVDETVLGKNHSLHDAAEVRVYESANDPWVPARRVWNQHGYFVANVNDDLTIPAQQQLHHLVYSENASCRNNSSSRPLNSFLNQSPFLDDEGCPAFASPDLAPVKYNATDTFAIIRPVCPATKFTISLRFTNQGDIGVSGNVPISFYKGDPQVDGELIQTIYHPIADLLPGQTVAVDNIEIDGPGSRFHLYVVINDDGTTSPFTSPNPNAEIKECPGPNNIMHALINPQNGPVVAVPVRDNSICLGGISQFNGAVKAYVPIGTMRDSVNFDFFWFDHTQTPGLPTDISDTSHIHTGLNAGDYTVVARHKTFGCSTSSAFTTIQDVSFSFNVSVTEVSNTKCVAPFDGSVEAVLKDGSGNALGIPDNQFVFTWYPPGELFTGDTLSSAKKITGLESNEAFELFVRHPGSGCGRNISATVGTSIVAFQVNAAMKEIDCFEVNSGMLTAYLSTPGDTTGYSFSWSKGSVAKTTPDYKFARWRNLSAGTYTVVAENTTTKCKSPSKTFTVTAKPKPVLTKGTKANQTSCDTNDPNGTAAASVSGGVGPFQFFWYTGANTNSTPISGDITNTATTTLIEGLKPQVYSVKVVDQTTNCAVSDTFKILNRFGPFVLTPNSKSQEHCLPLDGAAWVTPSITSPSITYTWYNGKTATGTPRSETGNTLSPVKAGFYTVKAVNSSTTCEAPSVTIQVLDETKTISIVVTPDPTSYPTECFSKDGTIRATITVEDGNTLGMDVNWFKSLAPTPPVKKDSLARTINLVGSPVSDELTGIASGYYTIEVINDDDGCRANQQYFLPTIRTDGLDVTPTDNTLCGSPGNGAFLAELEIKPKPIGATPTSKDDYIMELYSEFGGSTPIGTIDGTTNANNFFNFVNLDSGEYFVYAKRRDPSRRDICETFSDFHRVNDNITLPTLSLSRTINTNCTDIGFDANGQIVATIGGTPATSLKFLEGMNMTDHSNPIQDDPALTSLDNIKGGEYTVVLTTDNRCVIQESIFVPADTAFIVANVTPTPLTSCLPNPFNGQILINSLVEEKTTSGTGLPTGVAGYTISWFDATGTNPIADTPPLDVLEALDSGWYHLHVKNNTTHCESGLLPIRIEDMRVFPVINLLSELSPTSCLKIDLTAVPDPANYDILGNGQRFGHLDINYFDPAVFTTTWTRDNVAVDPANLVGEDVQYITADLAGDYKVTTMYTATGCSATETYPIAVDQKIITVSSNAVALTSCLDPNGQLSAIVTSVGLQEGVPRLYNDYMYLWYYGDTDTTSIAHKDRVVIDALNSMYTLVVKDRKDEDCQVTSFINLPDGRMKPKIETGVLQNLSICDVTKATPDGIAYGKIKDGTGNTLDYNWEWTQPPSIVIFDKDPIAENLLAEVVYSVRAIHQVTGCDSTANVSVGIMRPDIPSPNIEILSHVTKCDPFNLDVQPQGPDRDMPDGALSVSVGGNVSDYIFEWYNPGDPNNVAFTGILYDTIPDGEYTVKAIDKKTYCESESKATVEFHPVFPEFVIETEPTLCGLTTGAIFLTVTNPVEIGSIVWDLTSVSPEILHIEDGPAVMDAQAGTYRVTVTTAQACWTKGEAEVTNEINPFNGISRNGDQLNNYFHINCIESFPSNVVKIYNRAGTLVYEGHGYDNASTFFDGVSNKGISVMGTNLPDGTYFYVIDKRDGSKPLGGYLEIVN